MKAKCPYCKEGCESCKDGFIDVTIPNDKDVFTILCKNEECKFVNGACFGFPDEPSGECVMCSGETYWIEANKVVEDEVPPWVINKNKFIIKDLERRNSKLLEIISKLRKLALKFCGDGEITLEEAKLLDVCRICKGESRASFVYNYGKEYAHKKCLERDENET